MKTKIIVFCLFCLITPEQSLNAAKNGQMFFTACKAKLLSLFVSTQTLHAKKPTLISLTRHTASKEIQHAYAQFLHDLDVPTNEIAEQSFAPLLEKLTQLELAQYWLENSFLNAWQKTNSDTRLTALTLLKEFALTKDFLEELVYKHYRLNRITRAKLTHEKSALRQWQAFKKHILSFFLEADVSPGKKEGGLLKGRYDFKTTFCNISALGRLAAITTMLKTVKKFDDFAYVPEYIPPQTLLAEYQNLFSHWNGLTPTLARQSNQQATFSNLKKQFALLLTMLTRGQGFALRTPHINL